MTRPPKAKAIERLRKALDAIPELKQLRHGSQEFNKWHRSTRVAISNIFENEPGHVTEFDYVPFSLPLTDTEGIPDSRIQRAYVEGLESAASLLESMIGEIKEYWEEENQTPVPSAIEENGRIDTKEVFIIHGRDEGTREIVARFLEQLELTPVILAEQSNQGSTIIEKFERHAQAAFAVVLLTPDDVGTLQDDENNLGPRARQNVIFELGFFIGRLGRKRVCALKNGDVEIPSDYAGVAYISLDEAGGWKMSLVKELKSAGLDVDANRVF